MVNALLTGLMLGGMYALTAMGLTLQYGVARIMNLSYGEVLIAAAFASHFLFTPWAINPLVGLQLVAIDVRSTAALAFALGGALVAAGGLLVSMFLTFSATMGVVFTMKALIVVIMGGVGNLLGCLIAGLILGLAETL